MLISGIQRSFCQICLKKVVLNFLNAANSRVRIVDEITAVNFIQFTRFCWSFCAIVCHQFPFEQSFVFLNEFL